jgi:hypothetical protein
MPSPLLNLFDNLNLPLCGTASLCYNAFVLGKAAEKEIVPKEGFRWKK